MADLVTVLAQRDILDAMVQRLDRFLGETGENVSWKHGAVHSAIELIKDLRARLKAAEAELANTRQKLSAVEALAEAWEAIDAKNPSIPGMRTALAAELRTALGRRYP